MKKLGERLIDSGLITAEALEQALQQQRITGHMLGDCLVEIGLLAETALLRFLAADLNTRFVSSDKLAQAKIPTEVLDRIPVRLAERQLVLPIAWNAERKALTVVMAEPQNESLVKELAVVASADEVHAFIALRAPIQASIRKHYYGDPNAFAPAETGTAPARLPWGTGGAAANEVPTPGAARTEPDSRRSTSKHSAQLRDRDFAETLNVLVGMLEAAWEEDAGHSQLLARQAGALARRLGFPPLDVFSITVAAYLHRLGKPPGRHFTLTANDADPAWKAEAAACVHAPIRLFEAVHLPGQVNQILAHLYEAWDGSGVPQGAQGEAIARGARVLAAVDAYLELRRTRPKAEALAHLREEAGRLYDPRVVADLEQMQTGDSLRQRLTCDGRTVLVAEQDAGVRGALLEALLRAGVAADGADSLDGVAEAMARGDADALVVGLRFGAREVRAILDHVRNAPECAGAPVALLGQPPDPAEREQLALDGLDAIVPLPLEADSAAKTIAELEHHRIAHGGPARVVLGNFDELPAREVLSVLSRARKSGRLRVVQGGREAWLQLESGRVVYAAGDGNAPEETVRQIAGAAMGDFSFDANAVLMEMPNLDLELDALIRRTTPAS
jgi:HD-GYP domain-containing protein (c-di-GMP phosphodiesterase class II)